MWIQLDSLERTLSGLNLNCILSVFGLNLGTPEMNLNFEFIWTVFELNIN